MARSYHSLNISKQQQDFIRLLDEKEIDIFSISQIEKVPGFNSNQLQVILENLVNKQFLLRIERGKYCRANFRDEKVIGSFISNGGAIAYWSALNQHGLTEQFPNNIFIQIPRLKRNKIVFGTSYIFIKVNQDKFIGNIVQGNGNRHYNITDIEKTIVDCFDLPEYSGGYAELIRAFNQAKLNSEKMIEYCNAIDNISAIKRMGFLAELLNKQGLKYFIKFAKWKINEKYTLFDPFGNNKGEFVNDWRLRLNINRNDISEIFNSQY